MEKCKWSNELINWLLKKCKDYGGPTTTLKELNLFLKFTHKEDKEKFQRQEVMLQKKIGENSAFWERDEILTWNPSVRHVMKNFINGSRYSLLQFTKKVSKIMQVEKNVETFNTFLGYAISFKHKL